jgi:hypothetical protein
VYRLLACWLNHKCGQTWYNWWEGRVPSVWSVEWFMAGSHTTTLHIMYVWSINPVAVLHCLTSEIYVCCKKRDTWLYNYIPTIEHLKFTLIAIYIAIRTTSQAFIFLFTVKRTAISICIPFVRDAERHWNFKHVFPVDTITQHTYIHYITLPGSKVSQKWL